MGWAYMDTDDLWRMLGWEFSLMVATVRLINSGLLDELPSLKIHIRISAAVSLVTFRASVGSRIVRKVVQRKFRVIPACRANRLIIICSIDCFTIVLAGQPDYAAERGAEWFCVGLTELPSSQVVFATDYPQAVRDDDEIIAYVKAVGGLGSEARKILDGANAEKLIPNLNGRLNRAI